MSRIGKRIITIPENVTISREDKVIKIKGPKGELSTEINENVTVEIEDNELKVVVQEGNFKNIQGTINAHLNNMIIGVTEGFVKELEIIGVGYRFSEQGNKLVVAAGFSNPVEFEVPKGITIELPKNTQLIIRGIDKYLVGEFAANIRKIRKPEPYKGKGIRYKEEMVLRKAGKKAAK